MGAPLGSSCEAVNVVIAVFLESVGSLVVAALRDVRYF